MKAAEVKKELLSRKLPSETKFTTDKIKYYQVQDKGFISLYYFNSSDVCYLYVICTPFDLVNTFITELNKTFVIINPVKWRDYETGCDITYVVLETGIPCFFYTLTQ